jgi:hypothetical protein
MAEANAAANAEAAKVISAMMAAGRAAQQEAPVAAAAAAAPLPAASEQKISFLRALLSKLNSSLMRRIPSGFKAASVLQATQAAARGQQASAATAPSTGSLKPYVAPCWASDFSHFAAAGTAADSGSGTSRQGSTRGFSTACVNEAGSEVSSVGAVASSEEDE